MRAEPGRLIFIDETSVKTNMCRLRGRSPRGERLKGQAPFGKWHTQTFIAGLRCDSLVAPWVVNGAMDGEAFDTYVETQLAPTLERGDVVILDNLNTHKSQRAEDERALGAATTTDVVQTEARLARARARLAGASADLAVSRAEFVKQVGREPIDLEPVNPPVVIPPSLDDAMAIADLNEPRTAIAKKRAAAAEYDVKIARAEFAPKVAVGVSYQLAENPSFFVQNSDSLVYGARLSVPVFSGGLNRSRLKEAKARLRAVRQDTVFTERENNSEIAKAWARAIAADVARQSAEQEVIAAGMALTGVREEQTLGLRTTLDVLDAEQEKLNAEAFLAESERERNAAAVTLLSYIGALAVPGEERAWASFNTENLKDGADQ